MNYKLIGKPQSIVDNGRTYRYQIVQWDDGRKSIRWKGIVTYSENQRLEEKLSKKYKWIKEQK